MGEVVGPRWLRRARERLAGLRPHDALQRLVHAARGLLRRGRAHEAQSLPAEPELTLHDGGTIERAQLDPTSREAIELRDELLAVVSHDLRNPLSTISICTALLADMLPRPARTREVMRRLDVIRRSVDQMDRLIQDLLDTARADAGRLGLEPHEFRLAPLLAEALLTLHPLAAEKGQRLEIAVQDYLPLSKGITLPAEPWDGRLDPGLRVLLEVEDSVGRPAAGATIQCDGAVPTSTDSRPAAFPPG